VSHRKFLRRSVNLQVRGHAGKHERHAGEKSDVTSDTRAQTDYVSATEAADLLQLPRQTVYRMCRTGELAAIRTGVKPQTLRILRVSIDLHTMATAAPRTGGRP
jgi:excisionase family DNA binding protein